MPRLGIVLYHGIESGDELRQYGRAAERAGFESVWVTERYFHEETFSMLGFLAAATQRIRFGVAVANPYTRNPALLAMAAATLDRISTGRFVLGMGRSDRDVIEGRLGLRYGNGRETLSEAVAIVRDLLGGQRVSRQEGRFRLAGARLETTPVQPKVPMYLGAIGPKALSLAGAIGDGVLLNAYSPVEYVKYAVQEVRRGARAAGRSPDDVDIACMLVLRPENSRHTDREELRRRIVRLLAERHVGEVLLERGGFDPSILGALRASVAADEGGSGKALVTDEMVESFYVLGSPEAVKERIEEYRTAGVDLPLLLPRLHDFDTVAEFGPAPSFRVERGI